LINKGVNGIGLAPLEAASVEPVIAQAKAAGIPVVTFDSDAPNSERTAYYGTDNGSPNSSWVTIQLDWLPYNKRGGPSLWPWFNPKISAQYVAYSRFDGTTTAASDNNTFYLQAWLVF